jgi:hypothetical protein
MAEQAWRALSADEQQARIADVERQRRAADEQREQHDRYVADTTARIPGLVADLAEAGNPGLRPRQTTGWRPAKGLERLMRPSGRDVTVDLEPAWPMGTYAWRDQKQVWFTAETGFTPSGHIVLITQAAPSDEVEVVVARIGLPPDFVSAPVHVGARVATLPDASNALAHHLARPKS